MSAPLHQFSLSGFTICGVTELAALMACPFDRVVSIWNHEMEPAARKVVRRNFPNSRVHLSFFDDLEEVTEGFIVAERTHIEDILHFGADLAPSERVLIHCFAGLSRSTAVAFALACQMHPDCPEEQIYGRLLEIRPKMAPNERIVGLADEILARQGAMSRICSAHCKRLRQDRGTGQ